MQEQPYTQPPQDLIQNTPPSAPINPNQTANPGKGIGIAGFILALVPLTQIVGLILSIVGLVKSKRTGHKNPLALAGIIISGCLILLTIPLLILATITITSYNGISQRAKTSSAIESASYTQKRAELFMAENNRYPATLKEIQTASPSTHFISSDLNTEPANPATLAFYTCGIDGNKISYWNYTDSVPTFVYTGSANTTSRCALAE